MHKLPFEEQSHKLIIKKKVKTNPALGCFPENRNIRDAINYGVINVNKPKGPTSHQVSMYIQRMLHVTKAGHSGTLDPGVTGCLPVALAQATKVAQYLLTAGKEYVAIMHLHQPVDEARLREAFKKMEGEITQLPPVKSAVKREERQRTVYYLDILEIDGQDVLFRMGCQAGTYVRKLIHDLGQALQCGAHMTDLFRTKAGPFIFEHMFSLDDLRDAMYYYEHEKNESFLKKIIQPVETAVEHLKKVWVVDSAVDTLCRGATLHVPGIAKLYETVQVGDIVAVMTLKQELVGIGVARMSAQQIATEEKGTAVIPERVFMPPGMYAQRPQV